MIYDVKGDIYNIYLIYNYYDCNIIYYEYFISPTASVTAAHARAVARTIERSTRQGLRARGVASPARIDREIKVCMITYSTNVAAMFCSFQNLTIYSYSRVVFCLFAQNAYFRSSIFF